jgi:response regulator RpfG family c-di-GMP phosphodiesterase
MEKYTVLFVDDEPFILKAMKRLFHNDPLNILTASNGREGLEVIKSQPVQLLVSDNIMPEMTGVELIRHVKRCSPDTIRIILSGQSDMDSVLRAINDGEAYRFVLKPWNDIDLKVTVNLALAHFKLVADKRSLERELCEKNQLLENLRKSHPELFDTSQVGSSAAYEIAEQTEPTPSPTGA